MTAADTLGLSGISLIGLRGTGKSTVGRLLAERRGRDFVDADAVLEARAGRSIRAIFAEAGEPAFRELEEQAIADLTARPGLVLATGGGVVLRESSGLRGLPAPRRRRRTRA